MRRCASIDKTRSLRQDQTGGWQRGVGVCGVEIVSPRYGVYLCGPREEGRGKLHRPSSLLYPSRVALASSLMVDCCLALKLSLQRFFVKEGTLFRLGMGGFWTQVGFEKTVFLAINPSHELTPAFSRLELCSRRVLLMSLYFFPTFDCRARFPLMHCFDCRAHGFCVPLGGA